MITVSSLDRNVTEGAHLSHPYLTLPYLRGGCLLGRHPALRTQPSAHPRQTSRSIEPLWSFGKPQEEMPMDVTEHIQWKSKITKYFFISHIIVKQTKMIELTRWADACFVLEMKPISRTFWFEVWVYTLRTRKKFKMFTCKRVYGQFLPTRLCACAR